MNPNILAYSLFSFLKEMCFVTARCGSQSLKKSSVSVLVPCYDKDETIVRTVESALNQTEPPERVIVLLMESRMRAKVEALSPKVRCAESPRMSAAAARNTLAGMCETEWMVFLDADDRLCSNYIEETKKADGAFVFAPWYIKGGGLMVDQSVNWYVNGNFTCLCSKTAFLETGGFDETLGNGGEDADLIMRILLRGKWKIGTAADTRFIYDGSGGLSKSDEFYEACLKALNKWLPIFKEQYPYNAPCVNKNVCDFLDSIGDSVSEDDCAFFFNPRMKPNQTFQMFLATDNKIKCEGKLKFCL